MKRQDAIRIGELIERTIELSGSTATFNARKICYLWPEAVGPTVNRLTTARWIHRDELHVSIASGAVKSELTFMAPRIVERLNALAGTSDNPTIRRLIIH